MLNPNFVSLSPEDREQLIEEISDRVADKLKSLIEECLDVEDTVSI